MGGDSEKKAKKKAKAKLSKEEKAAKKAAKEAKRAKKAAKAAKVSTKAEKVAVAVPVVAAASAEAPVKHAVKKESSVTFANPDVVDGAAGADVASAVATDTRVRTTIAAMTATTMGSTLVHGVTRAKLWDIVADTDTLLTAAGVPPVVIRFVPDGEGTAKRMIKWTPDGPEATAEDARLRAGGDGRYLEYEEMPFEFERGRWFLICRHFPVGPYSVLKYMISFHDEGADGEHTRIEMLTGLQARTAADAQTVVDMVESKAFHNALTPMFEALDAKSLAHEQPRWVAPDTPVDEVRLIAGAKALLDMGEHPKVVDMLVDTVRTRLQANLTALAPRRLARQWGVPADRVISCFIRATRIGLLVTNWSVVCPSCRNTKNKSTIFDLPTTTLHCAMCNIPFGANLRDNVELTFTCAPALRKIATQRACVGAPTLTPHILAAQYVGEGEEAVLYVPEVDANSSGLRIRCAPEAGVSGAYAVVRGLWRIDGDKKAIVPDSPEDAAEGDDKDTSKSGVLRVRNDGVGARYVLLEQKPIYAEALMASDALNNPLFASLFRAEEWEFLAAMSGTWREGFGLVNRAADETAALTDGEPFQIAVVGSGPAGESCALMAARLHARVVLIEQQEVFGGPTGLSSKGYREAALRCLAWAKSLDQRPTQEAIKRLFDARFSTLLNHVVMLQTNELLARLSHAGITLVHGRGVVDDKGALTVERPNGVDVPLPAKNVVLAVGSKPLRPANVPFDGCRVVDAEEVGKLSQLPRSVAVIGGGIIALEYASIYAALGVTTHIVHAYDTCVPQLNRGLREGLIEEIERNGGRFHYKTKVDAYELDGDGEKATDCVVLKLVGGGELRVEIVLYARGREGSTDGGVLSADAKFERAKRGYLKVPDETLAAQQPGLFAVGDVIGPPGLASSAAAQGRRLAERLFGDGVKTSDPSTPMVLWTIPEVASVGVGVEQAAADKRHIVSARASFKEVPRGLLSGEMCGVLELVADFKTGRIIGVHILGAGAAELIHYGAMLIDSGTTCAVLAGMVFAAVTMTDLFRNAAERCVVEIDHKHHRAKSQRYLL